MSRSRFNWPNNHRRRYAVMALGFAAWSPAALAAPGPGSEPVLVVVNDRGCEPEALTVAAGKTTFKIRNQSARALEWEILNGVIVVEERENILPGFVQSLTAELEPGQYQMTCGLLSNPKGRLTVTVANTATAAPSALDLVGPLAEYKVYVIGQVNDLVEQTKHFAEAVKAGRLEEARKLYAQARRPYERIEPIAELFADLDKSIDARADDFEKKEADPAFIGFHRIEKALFADKTTSGMQVVADRLMADVAELKTRVATLTIPPKKMVGGAADLIEEVASTKISGEEDRYSHADLWDFQANVDGARKIFDLLHPLLLQRNSELVARVEKNFSKVDSLLGRYQTQDRRFADYEDLKVSDRNALKGAVTALAEDLSQLRGTLGLD
ncbi:MAG TPA: iron uptake system protein EfeO [Xanthobacteraceae bacterium]|nr:iron uptake system protein EfeO [Xanthobacteraceae bacterium]